MRVLMIHGIAQGGKDPDELKQIWISSLREGFESAEIPFPENVSFDFPYYGDTLDSYVNLSQLKSTSDLVEKGASADEAFANFQQQVLAEISSNRLQESEIMPLLETDDILEKSPQNWWWVRAIARTIDTKLTGVSDWTIERFLKEVFLYLSKPVVTRKINQIVSDMITNEETVVVGHSLGSVVGYTTLKEYQGRINLKKYITVGSPLGVQAISTKLAPLNNIGGPAGWFNAFDPQDIVALNPLDDRYFPTADPIENYARVDNKTSNQHGISGYLDNAEVAKALASVL